MNDFWSNWVIILSIVFLITMFSIVISFWRRNNESDSQRVVGNFDGIEERDGAVPKLLWFAYACVGVYTIVFFLLYPGLGNWQGLMQWHSSDEARYSHETSLEEQFERIPPNSSLKNLAQNPPIVDSGKRLFQIHCAACHRSKAQGQRHFPSLIDDEWVYGNTDEDILMSIASGRQGIMPGWDKILDDTEIKQLSYYIASLEPGREVDVAPAQIDFGQQSYMKNCANCHGDHAEGLPLIGAPKLNDNIWLHGGSLDEIQLTINAGINNIMPAFEGQLSLIEMKSIAAYIVSMAQQEKHKRATLSPALIEKGKYLAYAGDCVACHSAPGGELFSGGLAFETPLGKMYSTNISPHSEEGIGSYNREDFYQALKKGKGKHGYLYPAMPYVSYQYINNEDMDALWVYMQSVTPVSTPNKLNDMTFPANIRLGLLAWNIVFLDSSPLTYPEKHSDSWRRGKYLTMGLGHCSECHTPRNIAQALQSKKIFQGSFIDGWTAPNITANELHEGGWAIDSLSDFLKTGHSDKGTAFAGMADVVKNSTRFLSIDDIQAIAEYLITGDKYNELDTSIEPRRATGFSTSVMATDDYLLFAQTCGACHGKDGKGRENIAPTLLNNGIIIHKDPFNTIAVAIRGLQPNYIDPARNYVPMSSFVNVLNDVELARLISFVRQHLGGHQGAITAQEVMEIRELLETSGYTSNIHKKPIQ